MRSDRVRKCMVLAVLLTSFFCSSFAAAHILERPPFTGQYRYTDPHEAVEVFSKAVSRGELVVFGHRIENSMLVPLRVEYVYELDSAVPTIKVYSRLKNPISVPGSDTCKVYSLGATLDANGTIVEIESHVRTE
jgi:hypothetical protein